MWVAPLRLPLPQLLLLFGVVAAAEQHTVVDVVVVPVRVVFVSWLLRLPFLLLLALSFVVAIPCAFP